LEKKVVKPKKMGVNNHLREHTAGKVNAMATGPLCD